MSASYFLSPHVHLCVAGKQVVLLDLERDKYLSLRYTHPIGRLVRGWPVPLPETAAAGLPDAETSMLSKMVSQGLLVKDAAQGKEAAPVVISAPKWAMVEYDLNSRPHTTSTHLWRVFRAYVTAKWSLKRRPIKEVVQIVRLRKERAAIVEKGGTPPCDPPNEKGGTPPCNPPNERGGTPLKPPVAAKYISLAAMEKDLSVAATPAVDASAVRSLVTAFVHLRPLFFTSRDACLFDSLTLLNFLAGYGLFPEWVFGVKTDPFYAHCWVQQGDFVFNDAPDYVRGFSPILVV